MQDYIVKSEAFYMIFLIFKLAKPNVEICGLLDQNTLHSAKLSKLIGLGSMQIFKKNVNEMS